MLRQIAVHRAELLGPWKHLGKPFVLYAFAAILAPALFLSANAILHHMDGSAQPIPYESPSPPEIVPTKPTPDLEPASLLMSRIDNVSRELAATQMEFSELARHLLNLQTLDHAGPFMGPVTETRQRQMQEIAMRARLVELRAKQSELAKSLSDLQTRLASQPLQQSPPAPGGLAREPIGGTR